MTRIDFYHGATDKLQTAARIIRKAVGQAHRLVLFVPDPDLFGQIDRLLWMHPPTGFLPHCRADSALAPQTPVLLATAMDGLADDDVLVNLDTEVPPGFSRFRRLIEIIGGDEADKTPGRARFRYYRDRGYEIHRHDLAERSGGE